MKIVGRMTALILVFLLITGCFTGCGNTDTTQTTVAVTTKKQTRTEPQMLKLPYSKAEVLNPFEMESMVNRQLSALIYDSLFRVDSAYKPLPVIAKSYKSEGLKITVNVKTGLQFSDGTVLDAGDIVYSFTQARNSPAYAKHLSNFWSASKISDTDVVFTLKSADPYAVNCLDFAVIKYDDRSDLPLGSGRYKLSQSKGEQYLTANKTRLGGFSPKINKILLVNVTDSASLNHILQIGNLSFVFMDLRNGSYQRIKATALKVGMNNLVYLAFNSAAANLKAPAVRNAIAMLIDRNNIADSAFQSYARAAYTPFNPAWSSQYDFTAMPDKKAAVSLLEKADFTKTYDSGVRYSGWGNALVFTLLFNKDNPFKREAANFIAEQLWAAGIKVNLKALAQEDYTTAVKAGRYDMYLGEVMLTPNMDLSPLLSKGGSVSFGINTGSGAATAAYEKFLTGALDLKGFVDAFNADVPFVPLCYRNGIAAYTRTLKVPQQCSAGDVYCDIDSWTF